MTAEGDMAENQDPESAQGASGGRPAHRAAEPYLPPPVIPTVPLPAATAVSTPLSGPVVMSPPVGLTPPSPTAPQSIDGIMEVHRATNELLRDRRSRIDAAESGPAVRWLALVILVIAAIAVLGVIVLGAQALLGAAVVDLVAPVAAMATMAVDVASTVVA